MLTAWVRHTVPVILEDAGDNSTKETIADRLTLERKSISPGWHEVPGRKRSGSLGAQRALHAKAGGRRVGVNGWLTCIGGASGSAASQEWLTGLTKVLRAV